jgi:hypothetical protein
MDIGLVLIVLILLIISSYFMYAYFTCPTIGLEDNDPTCAPSTKTVGSCVAGWWNLWGSCRAGLEPYRKKTKRSKRRYTPVNTAMANYIKPIPAVLPVSPEATSPISNYLPITQGGLGGYPYNKFTWPSV